MYTYNKYNHVHVSFIRLHHTHIKESEIIVNEEKEEASVSCESTYLLHKQPLRCL